MARSNLQERSTYLYEQHRLLLPLCVPPGFGSGCHPGGSLRVWRTFVRPGPRVPSLPRPAALPAPGPRQASLTQFGVTGATLPVMRSREEVDKEDGRKSRDSGLPAFRTGAWGKNWRIIEIVWIDTSYLGEVLFNTLAFPCALREVNFVLLCVTSFVLIVSPDIVAYVQDLGSGCRRWLGRVCDLAMGRRPLALALVPG
ncbi:uncharacterized protein B0T23DRAFT_178375 [Neurospora hispaniola]|uniref:Uncharacterized protein n=1 Tax=Neurospora hispaniola TaxID=588809 RepID=A0AAJ0I6K8_9PEZI|nr:hypothetical protein B0T23DRAFT_178375 [Neurospora hispaniola]